MKNAIKDTASLNAQEIFTNKIYLDGDEIGVSMLPKLVHRVSLHPEVDGTGVIDRHLYTLHNDAGECLYISPHLSEYMSKRWKRVWKRRYLSDGDDGLSDGDDGNSNSHDVDDISGWYYGDGRTSVPQEQKRGWNNDKIVRAVSAWEKSSLSSFGLAMPILDDGTRMFKDCTDLKSFYSTNFKSCETATGMFEGCTALKRVNSPNVFYKTVSDKIKGVKYGSRMFAGSGLEEIELNLPALRNGSSMFEGCKFLSLVTLNLTNCKNMNRMFSNCIRLSEVNFPTHLSQYSNVDYLVNIQSAEYAFSNCRDLVNFNVPQMNKLTQGKYMFAGCSSLHQLNTLFPALVNGESMFQSCSDLSFIQTSSECIFDELVIGRRMFRDCSNFTGDGLTANSFPKLEDGFDLFRGVSLTADNFNSLKFPNLKNARQMFYKANITGHLDINFAQNFPNVNTTNGSAYEGGEHPVAYMFGSVPISSINFDVSTLDSGMSMFNGCTSLTTCTGAVFKSGGDYQSMFSESRFDATSAGIIIAAARSAGVTTLHIGMDSSYRTEEFKNAYGFTQLVEGQDQQWQCDDGTIVVKWN